MFNNIFYNNSSRLDKLLYKKLTNLNNFNTNTI